jgi:hypothetical protein
MIIPDAFRAMCAKLSYGAETPRDASESEFLAYLFAGFSANELNEIAQFIEGLLRDGVRDAQLKRIWRDAGSDFHISAEREGDIANFFEILVNAIHDRIHALRSSK